MQYVVLIPLQVVKKTKKKPFCWAKNEKTKQNKHAKNVENNIDDQTNN